MRSCPAHDEGIQFAYLSDIEPDPVYGLRINYDGQEGGNSLYVAVLIASENKSTTHPIGEGYKVITEAIKDWANPAD